MLKTLADKGREAVMVNLDPANEIHGAEFGIDIRDLIKLDDVTSRLHLGPNGGLVYCIEHLAENLDWLQEQMQAYEHAYFLLDCPGQVELYTHHNAMKAIVETMQQEWNARLVCVNLVDSNYCYDASKFVAVLLTCLSTMIQLDLPHVNVLSKIDLLDEDALPQRLEFFTEVMDLEVLTRDVDQHPLFSKYAKLSEALAGVVEDFGLVHFIPMNVQDPETVWEVVKTADKALGFIHVEQEEEM